MKLSSAFSSYWEQNPQFSQRPTRPYVCQALYLSHLIFYLAPLHTLHSRLLAGHWPSCSSSNTHKGPLLRVFAHAVPSAWDSFPRLFAGLACSQLSGCNLNVISLEVTSPSKRDPLPYPFYSLPQHPVYFLCNYLLHCHCVHFLVC